MTSKKRIFISFDYDNDRHYKNLLLAWGANDEFDFEFYDGSLKDSINSTNAIYVKSVIKPKITRSTHLLCIVGEKAAGSEWINWEIEQAIAANKKLIAVKLARDYDTPAALYGQDAKWALSFTFDSIKKAVDSA